MANLELHTCSKCELLDEIIRSKVKWYDVLSKENIILHRTLLTEKKEKERLLQKVSDLNSIVIEERNIYIKSCILFRTSATTSADTSNVRFSKEHDKKKFYYPNKQKSFMEIDYVKSNHLFSQEDINFQQSVYEDNLRIFKAEKEYFINNHNKAIKDMQEYCESLLLMLDKYRKELFKQKKENMDEHEKFMSIVKTLYNENCKYLQKYGKEYLKCTVHSVRNKMNSMMVTMRQQLKNRDQLVETLRKQQRILQKQIVLNEKDRKDLQDCFNEKLNVVQEELKNARLKYSTLEKRRALEGEGFRIDLRNMKKELQHLKQKVVSLKKHSVQGQEVNDILNNIQILHDKVNDVHIN